MTGPAAPLRDTAGPVRIGLAGNGAALAWFALALAGEVARLQLMQAGPLVGYQHYLQPAELFSRAPVAAAIVLAQAAIALAGLRAIWPSVRAWLARHLGAWRLPAVLLAVVLSSAALSASPRAYAVELVFAALLHLVALATLVCAAAALAPATRAALGLRLSDAALQQPDESPVRLDGLAWALALWVAVAGAVLALASYQAHPHVPDEVSYLFQARYFARGVLDMPPPPVPAAFDVDLMMYEPERWYSPVPPGWPAILSLGVRAGVPWIVNPILNGVNVLLAYLVLGDIFGRRTARWSVILLATSPWFVLMGMNLMTHTSALLFALVAAYAVARMRRSGAFGWGVLGGAAIGAVSLVRPLEGVAVALLLGFWSLGGRSQFRIALPQGIVLALASMAVGGLVLPYNAAVAGSPTTFPLMRYTDVMYGPDVNALGFGANRGIGWPGLDPFPGHGAIDVVINAALNTYQVNVELLGWSIGSVMAIALLLFMGRLRREDWWMIAAVAVVAGLHSFYWFSGGPDFGARYWYLIIVPCIALAARGVEEVGRAVAGRTDREGLDPRVSVAVLALCVMAVAVFIPWRAIDKYYHYRRMDPGIVRLAEEHDFGRSLVLVRGRRHPDYASAAIYNPLDFGADAPIYAWDRSDSLRADVLAAYPDRPVWIVDGPTVSGDGYRVRAGPLEADEARQWAHGGPGAARGP